MSKIAAVLSVKILLKIHKRSDLDHRRRELCRRYFLQKTVVSCQHRAADLIHYNEGM